MTYKHWLGLLAALVAGSLAAIAVVAEEGPAKKGFTLQEKDGEHLDVLLDGRTAARYMIAYDKSSPERLHETYKPYLHVFDAEGKRPITKGAGGKFTHHRGIFIGFSKLGFKGKRYDRWHMRSGEIVHEKFLAKESGPDEATITSLTHWLDDDDQPMLDEERTMTFRRGPEPARLVIDFTSKLTASYGPVTLDGDPEHAGVQYRPADEVNTKETTYVFPGEDTDPRKDLDLPWVGETYTLDGKRYSVVDLNHPDNPKGTRFSAYRDYGRFGAFFVKEIPEGESLTVRYRFLIAEGEMPPAAVIQKCWDDFAGVKKPTPVPPVTVKGRKGK